MSPPSVPSNPSGTWRTPQADANSPELPRQFGKYTLVRKLAKGGMAELYLAIQRSMAGFEKVVVIKRILPEMHQDGSFVDMLLSEARVAATLSHPNIVQTFDVGEVDGTYFIAMEHVHGDDIRGIVRQMKKVGRSEFPLAHAVEIALGISAGLAYAHAKHDIDGTPLNIVHRDISPQNVVVTFEGDVKIVDFGIAKSDAPNQDATEAGKLKGKIPYMSPEQARGDQVDSRSDIFSAGIILFELTTGKRLFKGSSEYDTMRLICESDYPRPSDIRENYPPALEAIVLRALEKNRDERYQSAREMQAALQNFARDERIDASNVALSEFMRGLFADDLAREVADKDMVAQLRKSSHDWGSNPPPARPATDPPRSTTISTPAAARTVTEVQAAPIQERKRQRLLLVGALASLVVLLGVGLGAWKVLHQPKPAQVLVPQVAALALDSDPPGATIWLNGEMRSEVTPTTIPNLPGGGKIDLRITKDGFEPAKQTVSLDAAETRVSVKLEAGHMVVEVKTKPLGAEVEIDGHLVEGGHATGLASGEHELVVRAHGFEEYREQLKGGPFETLHRDVELKKATTPLVPGSGKPVAVPSGAPSLPPKPTGTGKLNVGASGGWCNVSVDGVPRGPTPVAGLDLPAGAHRVSCTTEDGKVQNASVSIKPDETVRFRFAL